MVPNTIKIIEKLSKYTESLTKLSAPQLNIVIQPIRVKKDVDLT